jgi:hypothetical protein
MCKCTPELRTPFCGRGDCLPPASREPTESLFAVNAEQAALNWAHNYADKHQPRGSDSDADIAHLIVEQTKRIAELTIENGHLHIQLRQAEARETALKEALEHIRCRGCGASPATDLGWKWAYGEGYTNGHIIPGSVPDLCGPVEFVARALSGEARQ